MVGIHGAERVGIGSCIRCSRHSGLVVRERGQAVPLIRCIDNGGRRTGRNRDRARRVRPAVGPEQLRDGEEVCKARIRIRDQQVVNEARPLETDRTDAVWRRGDGTRPPSRGEEPGPSIRCVGLRKEPLLPRVAVGLRRAEHLPVDIDLECLGRTSGQRDRIKDQGQPAPLLRHRHVRDRRVARLAKTRCLLLAVEDHEVGRRTGPQQKHACLCLD